MSDYEKMTIGSLMLLPSMWDKTAGTITANDFSDHAHRDVYKVMAKLKDQGKPFSDVALIRASLKEEQLEAIGGVFGLATYTDVVPTGCNALHYAELMKAETRKRRNADAIVRAATEIELGHCPAEVGEKLAVEIEGNNRDESGLLTGRSMSEVASELTSIGGGQRFFPTGYLSLDAALGGGLEQDSLTIIAAAPSVGKSQLAINLCGKMETGSGEKARVLYESFEMGDTMLFDRLVAKMAGIDGQCVRQIRLGLAQQHTLNMYKDRYEKAVAELRGDETFIAFTKRALSPSEHRQLIAHYHDSIDVVIMDYIQLSRSSKAGMDKRLAMQEMSHTCKDCAKTYGIPHIVISSLSRAGYSDEGTPPQMHHLKECGDLEFDADNVWMLWREKAAVRETLELYIRKQRNGPLTMIPFDYTTNTGRIHMQDIGGLKGVEA